uniref:Phosphatidylinositol-glycan biosynthesis class W protein n=1 Tax=Elaeophora elaphi TaxID=1147741 RepID=A0A0R3RSC4_9BILA
MRNGTTQAEVLLFQTIGPMSLILRNVAVPGILHIFLCALHISIWLTFVLDLLFIVVPMVLTLTLFSDYIPLLLLAQMIILLIFVIILTCDYYFIKRRKRTYCDLFHQINDDDYSPTKFVTYMRFYALLATAVAILAVDFEIFPRRFAKTSIFGRSVMDVGTATFVYCFAVVDVFRHYPGRVKNGIQKQRYCPLKPSSGVVLIVLGIARTLLLHFTNYQYQINEYGMHWNFFITLGLLRLVVNFLGRRYHLLLGIIIAFTYQYFLTKRNLQEYLISNKTKRKDFVSKNREGIFSFCGYLSIYYLASAIANFLFTEISDQDYCDPLINFNVTEKRRRIKVWFYRSFQLLLLTAVVFVAQELAIKFVGPPSRRIANVPYILEMMNLNKKLSTGKHTQLEVHSETKIVVDNDENSLEILKPFLVDSINQQGLLFFVLANMLTGLVNKCINTSSVKNHYHATALITVYMCTCVIAVHLFTRLRKKINCENFWSGARSSRNDNSLPCSSVLVQNEEVEVKTPVVKVICFCEKVRNYEDNILYSVCIVKYISIYLTRNCSSTSSTFTNIL